MTSWKIDPATMLIKYGLPALILVISIGSLIYGQSLHTEMLNAISANQAAWQTFLYDDLGSDVDNISSMAIDKEGKTWISTNGCRLFTYDGEEWTKIDLLDQPTEKNCNLVSISFEPEGKPLVGVSSYGANGIDCIGYYYDKEIWKCIASPDTEHRNIEVISYSRDNPIYKAGGYDTPLHLFYKGSWHTYPEDPRVLAYTSIIDHKGAVWFGTTEGVIVFEDGEWIDFSDMGFAHLITIDHNNRVWLGSNSEGIRVYDGDDFASYQENNSGFPSNNITGIAIASDGTAWIGTEESGVVSFDGKRWVHYKEFNSGIMDDKTIGIASDSHLNQIWILHNDPGEENNGLSVVNLNQLNPESVELTSKTSIQWIFINPYARWIVPLFLLGLWILLLANLRDEVKEVSSNHKAKIWVFWIVWTLISSLALGRDFTIRIFRLGSFISNIFSGFIPVVLLVLGQCLIIQTIILKNTKWCRATLIGIVFGLIAFVCAGHIARINIPGCQSMFFYYPEWFCDPEAQAAVYAISIAGMGIMIGLVQALLLYKELKRSWLWALTATLLWIYIGATWASTGVYDNLLIGLLSGAAYGSISGSVLIWIMRGNMGGILAK